MKRKARIGASVATAGLMLSLWAAPGLAQPAGDGSQSREDSTAGEAPFAMEAGNESELISVISSPDGSVTKTWANGDTISLGPIESALEVQKVNGAARLAVRKSRTGLRPTT